MGAFFLLASFGFLEWCCLNTFGDGHPVTDITYSIRERKVPVNPNKERESSAKTAVRVSCRMKIRGFEKQCDQNKTTWLPLNDFSHKDCKTKLLDGLGTSANLIY